MNQHKMLILGLIGLLLCASLLFSFSIFTNSSGFAQRYLDSDIPFSYQLNDSTPSSYFNLG